jgi:hypothetical protein
MSRAPSNAILDSLPAGMRESLLARMQPLVLPVRAIILKPGEGLSSLQRPRSIVFRWAEGHGCWPWDGVRFISERSVCAALD